jgi:hypothetical protein
MKKIALILLLTMVTLFSAEAHKYKNAHVTISIQTFYNELSPYGDWIYSSDFGYVWRPYFDYPEAFRPYSSNGNWVYGAGLLFTMDAGILTNTLVGCGFPDTTGLLHG